MPRSLFCLLFKTEIVIFLMKIVSVYSPVDICRVYALDLGHKDIKKPAETIETKCMRTLKSFLYNALVHKLETLTGHVYTTFFFPRAPWRGCLRSRSVPALGQYHVAPPGL